MKPRRLASSALALAVVLGGAGVLATPPGDPAAAPIASEATETASDRPAAPAAREGDVLEARAPADTVVAIIGERRVTLAEVDALVPADARRSVGRSPLGLHQVRGEVLDMLVMEILLQRLADQRGLDGIDALVRREIDDAVPPPSHAEVLAFYEDNRHRMQGQPFEAMRDGLVLMLHDRAKRQAFAAWIDRLKAEAGVRVRIPEPRVHVDAVGPARGPAEAPVTIVVFLDYECPFCAKSFKALELVQRSFPSDVRLVVRDLPLPSHPNAARAAEAARCAAEQDQFWGLSPLLFAARLDLTPVTTLARQVRGLDVAALEACLDSGRHRDAIRKDVAAAERLGIDGTPTVFVNGRVVAGAVSVGTYRTMVDEEMGRVPLKLDAPLEARAATPPPPQAAPEAPTPAEPPVPTPAETAAD